MFAKIQKICISADFNWQCTESYYFSYLLNPMPPSFFPSIFS